MAALKIAIGTLGTEKFFDHDLSAWLESIRLADELGVDQINLTEHVVMGERVDRYPYGRFPLPLDYPWYEPIVILSAVAAVTRRMRLSTGVLIGPLRSGALLAKQLATLDTLSRGRVDIGLGVGWQEEEYAASGIPFAERYTRLDEQVRICRLLWSQAPASFAGHSATFENIHAFPRPPQGATLPIWFGLAPTPRNCRRIAELGDGWTPIRNNVELITEGVKNIRAALADAGRDPALLQVRAGPKIHFREDRTPDLAATGRGLGPLLEAGVTTIEFWPSVFCSSREQLPAFYEQIVEIKKQWC
jgi:probable F420-dependent oxidoreductase